MSKKIPRWLKNFYFLFGFGFIIWLLFFDSSDFLTVWQNRRRLKELEKEKEYYLEKIEEVKKETLSLGSDTAMLEKFAREKYLMKKDNEDIFIIDDKK
ncbi:MAG: septum formation initiator [Bacteroidetes bacterium RIFCSPLOWO2_02_FULL_36_8]|nr:MAG: septum formation initiator [Bacteroidetes bacterium RIFCSPLOWO2_02_FULL_36_8]OFY72097.1 MAG: septum formation initiator [Bacteroidetes bacterium RIFCSPLOWO2_12_FULL_37_12]